MHLPNILLSLSFAALVSTAHIPAQLPLASGAPHQQPVEPSLDRIVGMSKTVLPAHLAQLVVSLHKSLVSIESITGNEKEVGNYLVKYLEKFSFDVEKQFVSHDPDRFNILAWPSKSKKEDLKVLLSSHIDTVPPFIPYHRNGTTLSGRGTVDAKPCVAAQITALLDLLDQKRIPSSSTGLLFVVGEETGGDGMTHFSNSKLNSQDYSAVIFGEPTEGKLACGHKGNMGFTIKVQGKAAHSGYPWLGLSANDVLLASLAVLKNVEGQLPKSSKYGMTTVNVGRIDGGVAANVVAEKAEAKIAVRLAGGNPQEIRKMLANALTHVKKDAEEKGGSLEIEYEAAGYGPVSMECDVEGFETITVNYGTDVPNLKGGHKRFLYGPGSILVAHSDHEALDIGELQRAVKDYEKLVLAALDLEKGSYREL